MSFATEFRTFAARGNVVDMAVGIIIGAAFGKIVAAFVADVLMPPIGLLLGGKDFSRLALTLKAAHDQVPAVTLNYGHFIQTCVDFIIIAFAVFLVVKGVNRMRRPKEEAAPPAPPKPTPEEALLTEIRDLLKARH